MTIASRSLTLFGAVLLAAVPAHKVHASESDSAIEQLQAQVRALQAEVAELRKQNAPEFKAAPQFKSESGMSFKVRGRLNYDVGYVANPNDAIDTKNLGFNSRVRRARLGVEGDLPGGFSYKAEADFNNNTIYWADLLLEYAPEGQPFSVAIGHRETFQGLEQIASSRFLSFMERAQMSDAFVHDRRLGVSAGFASGDLRIDTGIFNDTVNTDLANDDWLFAVRATYAPELAGGLVHLGGNYQHRKFQSNARQFRYRARPFLRTTDVRFVDTDVLPAESDNIYGVELAGIFGSLHVASEAQWVKVNALDTAAAKPDLFAAYAEVGYWLTGETRGYKDGRWDRTKVRNPFDKGGAGAFQVNLRYDRLDLRDRAAGIDGGTQTGYLASLIWQPIDYVRFIAQYVRAEIEHSPSALDSFGVDIYGMRAQFDF